MKHQGLPFHVRLLKDELANRQKRNKRYSLRGFASFLKMHPSALSRILSLKQDLSIDAAAIVLKRLDLGPAQARLFIASVAEVLLNRSMAVLTRAIEPKFLDTKELEPRFEQLVRPSSTVSKRDALVLSIDQISVMDLEGRFLYINETLAYQLDSLPCDLIGRTWRETDVNPEMAEILENQQGLALTCKDDLVFEFSAQSAGRFCFFERRLSPIFGDQRVVRALRSSLRDVTLPMTILKGLEAIHASRTAADVGQKLCDAIQPYFCDHAIFVPTTVSKKTKAKVAMSAASTNLQTEGLIKVLPMREIKSLENLQPLNLNEHRLAREFLKENGCRTLLASPVARGRSEFGSLLLLSREENRAYKEAERRALIKILDFAIEEFEKQT